MKTILITGCSSGFGLETAQYFLERGWNVVATMRTPRPELFPTSDRLKLVALDVTDADSIAKAVALAGPVDVLVNNAGVGMLGVIEAASMETIRSVFEANTLGTIAVTQAFLPVLRQQGGGVIVNVTSSTTLKPLPLLSAYTASKAAVEAFTASLALELAPFGISTHIVLPGRSAETQFRTTARGQPGHAVPADYEGFVRSVGAAMAAPSLGTEPQDVAAAIWQAATDEAAPFRIPAGADATELFKAA